MENRLNFAITLLIYLLPYFSNAANSYHGMCSDNQIGGRVEATLECLPRETLMKLDLPNNTYMHMVPDHVMVQRCGGSCHLDSHKSCIPTARGTRIKEVPVWLYPVSSTPGAVNAQCSVAALEEHTECECGCARTADSCNYNQRFEESRCTCACVDLEAKVACYSRPGWFWSEDTCQCMCRRPSQWPQCPIGSQFDPLNSCSCIPVTEYATPVLAMLIVILVLGVGGTLVSVIHCHRKNIGLFSYRRRQNQNQSRHRTQSTASATQHHRMSNASTSTNNQNSTKIDSISNKLLTKFVRNSKPQPQAQGAAAFEVAAESERPLVKQQPRP